MTIRENEFNSIGKLLQVGKTCYLNKDVKLCLNGIEEILLKVKKRDLEEKANGQKKQQQNLFNEVKA